ncbi:uncharacterized protein LOC111273312 [Varroa jacobsoni]|uniref:uncharacterized protein LOC111273312 n=1 Tax=Varroa jacobsoni TaxID=62625 RepID=UPI000BF8E55D|nr:uncharacterized protein LOC111273312 [Varroa jacobsoni]
MAAEFVGYGEYPAMKRRMISSAWVYFTPFYLTIGICFDCEPQSLSVNYCSSCRRFRFSSAGIGYGKRMWSPSLHKSPSLGTASAASSFARVRTEHLPPLIMLHNKQQIPKAVPLRLVIVFCFACSWMVIPVGTLSASPTYNPTGTTTTTAVTATTVTTVSNIARPSNQSTGVSKSRPITNVSVTNGSTVDMSCSVATDTPTVIVWLQGDSFKVLFFGSNRVTNDKRMSVRILVEEGAIKSTLRIEPVKPEDQGKFICRVPRKDHIDTEVILLSVKVAPGLSSTQAATLLPIQSPAQIGNDTVLTVTSR